MANVMEIAIKAIDQATDVLKGIQETTEDSNKKSEISYTKLGLSITASGAALNVLANSQKELSEQTKILAAETGMTSEEMRQLAIDTANVTFPLNEALDLFELARQQGVTSGEALQEYAWFWDTLGDATGGSSKQLASAGVALQSLGIQIGEESEALSAFGYIQQETTGSVQEFLDFVQKTGPELKTMGMDVNDTAAILGVLEKEFGYTGRTAKTEFTQAVSQSDGNMQKLLQTLGISSEQMNTYKGNVEDCSDVIQRNADIHAESFTIYDKFKHSIAEITYKYGDQIAVLGDLGGVMMGAGSIITAVAQSQGLLTAAQNLGTVATTAFGTAMNFALGPVGLAIIAITALVSVGVALYKNWDTVMEVGGKVVDYLGDKFQAFADFLGGIFRSIGEGFKLLISGMLAPLKFQANLVIGGINFLTEGLNKFKIDIPSWVPVVGGNSFGFNIPKIPQLAKGGYIKNRPGGILANIGEGSEPEIVAPESKLREIVREGQGVAGTTANIYFMVDGDVLANLMGVKVQGNVVLRTGGVI